MSSDVPRRAAFDDLRVGQLACRLHESTGTTRGGVVTHVGQDHVTVKVQGVIGRLLDVQFERTDANPLFILRDAPAPPVKVRREDYDALVAEFEAEPTLQRGWITGRVRAAVCALIDHADTGADHE